MVTTPATASTKVGAGSHFFPLVHLFMPIRVQCACGKTLAAPDAAAGRAVKCPGCGKSVQVPAASTSVKPAAKPPAAADGLDDLFDEEGFGKKVSKVCPACRQDMKPGSVLCTKCGYHTEQGVRLAGHLTPGVDISSGTIALQKAAADMAKEKKLQKDLDEGAGMPTWALGLILTILSGLATIGVVAINLSQAAEESGTSNNFNAAQTFFLFGGVCCAVVGVSAHLRLVWRAFKEETTLGLMVAFVPLYIAYFAWTYRRQDKNFKMFTTEIVLLSLAGLFFYGANAS